MLCPPRAVPLLAILFSAANAQQCETDVVVVGAGFSGLAAGKTLKDAGLTDFFIVESTDRIGGRVKSNTAFGLGRNKTIEECANWIYPGTPIFDLVKESSLDITLQDFFNYDVYEYNQSVTVSLLFPGFSLTLLCLTLLVFLCVVGCRLLTMQASMPHLSPRVQLTRVSKNFGGRLYRIACTKPQLSSSSQTVILLITLLHSST